LTVPVDERFLPLGDEAGTAPGDRPFRPDVEGLRAVAIALVVLYHAGFPGVGGGYVGVDVFFVISGFVITGLLLRERAGTGRTSILGFYARRCRRILPAATLVLLVTVVATYLLLGSVSGNATGDDARWAAVFLSNFHFKSLGANYFTSQGLPSPLQNFWSLSVEEQFYIVYPTFFLLLIHFGRRASTRRYLAFALGVVIAASYILSVVLTRSHPNAAYFSPLTRAWELALGALVAVATTRLKRIPARAAAVLTWGGLAAIACSALVFKTHTPYPGSLVAVPVVGAALVIAGGAAMPGSGAEKLLGLSPFRWLGKRSYSLYLWHWPILVIAVEHSGKRSLPLKDNLALVLLALVISMASYRWVENPVRHWRLPSWKSVSAGVALVLAVVAGFSYVISRNTVTPVLRTVVPARDVGAVVDQVAAAARVTTVPESVALAEYGAAYPSSAFFVSRTCWANINQARSSICDLGDPSGSQLMVLLGDSKALMWTPAFEAIARADHWRLILLVKVGCRAAWVPGAVQQQNHCPAWHQWASKWVNQNDPNLLVVSQLDTVSAKPAKRRTLWREGLNDLFDSFKVPAMREVLLGSTPTLAQGGPVCLSVHRDDAQVCSSTAGSSVPRLSRVDKATALADHVEYVDTTPWFCSKVCTPVVGSYELYDTSGVHITSAWAQYLQNVVAESLSLPPPTSSATGASG
jgi:peptidoglycan/LPS O-acetylase OafA/YrhL